MGIFKKTIQYKKQNHFDKKIEALNEDLKRTNVSFDSIAMPISESKKEDNLEETYYDWRSDFYDNVKTKEDELEEELAEIRNKKIESLKRVDNYISQTNSEYYDLEKQIFEQISQNFLLNIPVVEKKLDRVLQIYNELHEGLLNEPPSTNNSDPLTPLDQKFVTVDELNKHYNLFINRIQEQVATIGGGGETRLKYLDDIVGIATNPSDYDGKFLKYDHASKRFVFEAVVIEEVQALHNVLGYGNTSTRGLNVGVSTFAGAVVNGSLEVQRYGVETGLVEHTSQVGIASVIDSFDVSTDNFLTAEYTIHVGYGTYIQSQKVLVMQNGQNAYSQEYGIMYQPESIVSFGATMNGNTVVLQATPESGIIGVTTYRFVRGSLL